jgi:hypothetical protein
MTDNWLGERGRPAQPQLQMGWAGLDTIISLSGTDKTLRSNQFAFHHAAAVSLLSRSVATAYGLPLDAGA